ncbi:MAG: class I tRNA ligase family protein, partial [Candidatus Liptonbacteria bacterium]
DLLRTRHTAEIVSGILGGVEVILDERLRETNFGPEYNNQNVAKFERDFPYTHRLDNAPPGGESRKQVRARMLDCVMELNRKYEGKKILIVSHGDPLLSLQEHFGSELPWPDFAKDFELDVSIADLHRPYIDQIVLKCDARLPDGQGCGGEARRVPEIFDSWVEAGSMPFAEFHYPFDQKEIFEARFPGQFVAEYIAQTRAWFYVMHVISLELFGKAPFEHVVTTGTILAEDGSKMSKSKNNFPDPWVVIEKYGVDALRFYLMNSSVMQADNLNFSERELGDLYRKNILIPWNILNYFLTYSAQADWQPAPGGLDHSPEKPLDKWIWARTKELVNNVTENLDAYDTVRATRAISEYVDDLSTWYLRRSRGRTDEDFFGSLRHALLNLAKVSAPFTPYLSELIYTNLNRRDNVPSVHLADWPTKQEVSEEERKLLMRMKILRDLASLGMAKRKELNIPVRQPLQELGIRNKELEGAKELLQILREELNVKNIKMDSNQKEEIVLDTTISNELRLEGLVRGLERAIQALRKQGGFRVGEMANLTYRTEDADLRKAIESFNRSKTYITAVAEGESGEVVELDGKKITLSVSRI